jgi:hypothetical protein
MAMLRALKYMGQALLALKVTEGVIEMTDTGEKSEVEAEVTEERRTLIEEIEVEAEHVVERVKALLHEGNIRTLRIKDKSGKYLLEVPLTIGVLAGGVFALTAPAAVALSALAGIVADVKIEIIRDNDGD